MNIQIVLAKILQITTVAGRIAVAIGNFIKSVASAVNDAKLFITEVAGGAGALVGISNVIGWQYAIIIGGLAVVLAVERQPGATPSDLTKKAVTLKAALLNAKASGKLDVMIDDVLRVL